MTIRLVKVVFAGDGNVGKTTLIRSFTHGKFDTSRIMTIGVDFHTHTVDLPEGKIKLSVWDMAGQERFESMRPGFYPGSRVAALVFDVTVPESLEHLNGWRDEILKVVPDEKFIVVGNKVRPRAGSKSARSTGLRGQDRRAIFRNQREDA